jgi:hypothetical protein
MSKSSEAVKRWRKNTKDRMVKSMGGCCQICGYNRSHKALEFHHIDPNEKEMGFGETRANNVKWSLLVEELRKCILLCSNCHKEVHEGITNLPNSFAKFNEDYKDYSKMPE